MGLREELGFGWTSTLWEHNVKYCARQERGTDTDYQVFSVLFFTIQLFLLWYVRVYYLLSKHTLHQKTGHKCHILQTQL